MIYKHLKFSTNLTIIGSFLFLLSFSCTTKEKKSNYRLNIKEGIDTSIILVNLGHLNRSELGELILRIDSCHPNSITINAIFRKLNDPDQDSVLIKSLQRISGDLLTFYFDSLSQPVSSNNEFAQHVDIQGLNDPIVSNGLITHFKPISEVNGKLYPALALEIAKKRIPGFQPIYKANKSIPIEYSKLSSSIIILEPDDFQEQYICSAINNKIILIGFLGPGDEDKFYTPLRYVMENSAGEPDTYGTVILANQVWTIINQAQMSSD